MPPLIIPITMLCLHLLFSSGQVFAQTNSIEQPELDARTAAKSSDEGGVIREIRIEGQKKIEKDAILAKVKSKTGSSMSREQVASDIALIHGLGFFDDVSVDWQNGVLIYTVKERPTVSSIVIEGNEQISTSDLKEVVKVKEYSILDFAKVKEDVSLIQKHYEEKGFYLARVEYEIVPVEKSGENVNQGGAQKGDEVKLVYRIADFEKVRIKQVQFINNHKFSDEKLKSLLRNTREGNFLSWLTSSGNFRESAFKQDLQLLSFFYLTEGYVKFRYDQPVVTVSEDKKWLFVSIYVDEGESFKVDKVDFSGDLLFDKTDLHAATNLTAEKTFNVQTRNEDIQRLTEKYQDLGYAFVNVNPKMEVHEETRTVDINYEFEKGNLVHFGEINVVGNSKTRDKVVRRELRIVEGELYNGTRFRKSRERVERLGFFAADGVVFNTVTPKDKPDVLDVEIQIKERSTGTVTLGLGYGSVQKFFLTAQIAEINLFGRGQNLTLSGQYSQDRRQRSLSLGFVEPYFLDSRWSAGGDVFFTSYLIPGRYLLFRRGFNLRTGHPINDEMNLFGVYKFEDTKPTDVVAANVDISDDIGLLSSVVTGIERDVRNNRFETTSGDYERISAEYAGLGGRKFFVKFQGNARYYKPLIGDLVLRTNFEIGHIIQSTPRNVPPSERFFLGGPNSLKGFNMFSISPRYRAPGEDPNSRGIPVGGVSQWLYNLEFEYPLIKEAGLKFVLFGDAGNSYASIKDMVDFIEVKKDWGFGFRWFSPIGPLRFEWGFPIQRQPYEDAVNFQFFIGPPF